MISLDYMKQLNGTIPLILQYYGTNQVPFMTMYNGTGINQRIMSGIMITLKSNTTTEVK